MTDMHPRRTFKVLVVFAALALVVAGCAGSTTDGSDDAAPESTAASEEHSITFALLPNLFFSLPVWVADEKGFFTDEGVAAEFETISGGGAQVLAALAGGSADLTYATVQQVALSNQEGNPLRIVSGNHTAQPYAVVVQKSADTPAEGAEYPEVIQALEGKIIAVTSFGSGTHLQLQQLLEGAGMSEDDVSVVQGGSTPVPAFEAGEFDAIIQYEPTICNLTVGRDVGRIVMDFREPGGVPAEFADVLYQGWIAQADRAEEPGIEAAARALQTAILYIQDEANVEEVAGIAAENLGETDEAVTQCQIESSLNGFNPTMSTDNVQFTLDTLDLEEPQTPDDILAPLAIES